MTGPKNLSLYLWDCRRVRTERDVLEIVQAVRDLSLLPADGVWSDTGHPQPASDLEGCLARHHHDIAAVYASQGRKPPAKRYAPRESWILPLVRAETPGVQANLAVGHRQPGTWSIEVYLSVWSYRHSGQTLDAFCASWGELLEAAGNALWRRAEPRIGWLIAEPSEAQPELYRAADRGQLIVGWRTWFGSAYVDAFGRDWLLALPDWATPADGGVRHGLDASVATLVQNNEGSYTAVRSYLDRAGVPPAWPAARSTAASGPPHTALDAELTTFRRDLRDLLSFTMSVGPNQRVKVFAPDWSIVHEPHLGEAKRALVLQSVRDAAERELREHPDAEIRFELGEGAPDELRQMLDAVARVNPRLSYVVLPGQN
jgi:hypothetical protein